MKIYRDPNSRRIDIDLLRAVAVLAVIFFHFEIPGFDGGFLGVDIFFVISGYLITLHIQQQLSESRFSFFHFYLRRIRRLFPALIATFVVCSFAAILILPKSLLNDYSHSQIASSIYASNIYFWSVADYFDTDSILKPLLHTWSLSVEEQFYIIWPLFLLLTFSGKPKIAIGAAAILSLLAAELVYDASPKTTFYLFPFRIFEFSIGALMCGRSFDNSSTAVKNLLLLISSASIFFTLLLASEQDRHPGLLTLPICFGAALIIGLSHPWMNRLNAISAIFLRIGLISYSAYLIHWPLVVFYKIENARDLVLADTLTLLVITYVLAEIFYNCVEKPTSKIHTANRKALIFASLPAIFAVALVFNYIQPDVYRYVNAKEYTVKYVLDSIPDRKLLIEQVQNEIEEKNAAAKLRKRKKIVVTGDSHALDTSLALQLLLANTDISVERIGGICDPLTLSSISISIEKLYENHAQDQTKNPRYCLPHHSSYLQDLIKFSPDLIVFSEAWRPDALPFLAETIREIKAVSTANVLILGRNFQLRGPPNVIFGDLSNINEINTVAWERRYQLLDNIENTLMGIAKETGSYFISKNELVCPGQECKVLIGSEVGYTDSQHWSVVGLNYYGAALISHEVFKAAIGE